MEDRGTYYKEGSYYCYKLRLDGRNHVRKRKTKPELKKAVKELLTMVDAGRLDDAQATFKDVADRKFAFRYGTELADGTIKLAPNVRLATYMSVHRSHKYALAIVGSVKIGRFGLADIMRVIEAYREKGRTAELVLNYTLQVLPKSKRDDIKEQMEEHGVKLDYRMKSRERVLSKTEVVQLATLKDEWFKPLYVFLVGAGLRIGEAAALTWADVDLDAGTVSVTKQGQWQMVRRGAPKVWHGNLPTKNGKTRVVHLTDIAKDALVQQKRRLVEFSLPTDGLVFLDQMAEPIKGSTVNKAMERWLKASEMDKATLHDLRRTFATLLASVDPNVANTAAAIGDSVATAATHYIKPADQGAAIKKLEL